MKPIRVLVAAFVGGIIVFAWGAVSHMMLPIGDMGIQNLPDEEAFAPVIREHIKSPGLYLFPGMPPEGRTEAGMAEWTGRVKAGPNGILIVDPGQGPDQIMPPSMLAIEWGANTLAALVAAAVLSGLRGPLVCRAGIVGLLGVFAWLSIDVSYWNWYKFPTMQTLGELIDQAVGWSLAGLAMSAIIPRAGAPAGA
ncbi:MAG: hypothetical protein IPJ41_05390 [Phycisphaerales bacterium]|nr:hypothetical protein [Phycisphaerales bacterium]